MQRTTVGQTALLVTAGQCSCTSLISRAFPHLWPRGAEISFCLTIDHCRTILYYSVLFLDLAPRRRYCRLFTLLFEPDGLTGSQTLTQWREGHYRILKAPPVMVGQVRYFRTAGVGEYAFQLWSRFSSKHSIRNPALPVSEKAKGCVQCVSGRGDVGICWLRILREYNFHSRAVPMKVAIPIQ